MTTFTALDVQTWDVESVAGWLDLMGLKNCVNAFRNNGINGNGLLDLDEGDLEDLGITGDAAKKLTGYIQAMKKGEQTTPAAAVPDDDDDSDDDDGRVANQSALKTKKSSTNQEKISKKKDPLRIAAKSKAVADLEHCTVTSGFLWKIGGSGLKLKHWKRRFFVLTDDNCLYYFKSPKDMSALGMILLPSYTITLADKADNVGGRAFAFKAFNRFKDGDRQYVFAAESEQEMKVWMNVMSLACIAFGTGEASMSKDKQEVVPLSSVNDEEFDKMQERAALRAGGVTGDGAAVVSSGGATASVPNHLQKTLPKQKGRTLALIKLLDGETLQLYAEGSTTGQMFFDQVCSMLKAYEKYYFGLSYIDRKGDEDWIKMDKKILRHDFDKGTDHIELSFKIRFYPIDVTQVLQYVTLYQAFLAARHDVVNGKLSVTARDSMLLAALSLQAMRGDYNPEVHTADKIDPAAVIPRRTMQSYRIPPGKSANDFWVGEATRVWGSVTGILKHLAVLKYMQIIQKHRLFGMRFVEVKNKKGTPLTLGISPKGLFVYRYGQKVHPVVKFSWAECSELAYTEKKFKIAVHDKETKAFSVYCSRPQICQRVLHLCIGLHRLYVMTVRGWAQAPADLAKMRSDAIDAAAVERENLKKEAQAASARARELRGKQETAVPEQPAAPAPNNDGGDAVIVKGRDQALKLMDMMMSDTDFMRMQDELFSKMEDDLGDGYTDVGGADSEEESEEAQQAAIRERCQSEAVKDRATYLESLEHSVSPTP
eukprot:m.254297 g.254297  ORF g.254297 m.254297 type:complete len:767 (-) comp16170_c2_seq1:2644-4944(-)